MCFPLASIQPFSALKGRLHWEQVLIESVRQYLEGRPAEIGEAVFDKEDDLAVEFVTAAANLRAANYNIPQQSLFVTKVLPLSFFILCAFSPDALQGQERDLEAWQIVSQAIFAVQGMAGNITHAIATTNAIVGGLIVVEAMKLLAGKPEASKVAPVHTPQLIATSLSCTWHDKEALCNVPCVCKGCL